MNTNVCGMDSLREKLKRLTLDTTPKIQNSALKSLLEAILTSCSRDQSGSITSNRMANANVGKLLKTFDRAVCNRCHTFPTTKVFHTEKNIFCESCRGEMSSDPQQTQIINEMREVPNCLMDIIDALTLPCINVLNGNGCSTMVTRKTKDDHSKICKEKLQVCSTFGFSGCDFFLNFTNVNSLGEHLMKYHNAKTLKLDNNGSLNVTIPDWGFPGASGKSVNQENDGSFELRQNLWSYIVQNSNNENCFIFLGTREKKSLLFSMLSLGSCKEPDVVIYGITGPNWPEPLPPHTQPIIKALKSRQLLKQASISYDLFDPLIHNTELLVQAAFLDVNKITWASDAMEDE